MRPGRRLLLLLTSYSLNNMAVIKTIFLLIFLTAMASGLKLPTYISPCKRSDPNFNQCAIKNGRAAIPYFVAGDRKYQIPKLNPLSLENLSLDHGSRNSVGLKIFMKNAKIYGLDKAHFDDANFDLGKKHVDLQFRFDSASIVGDYKVSGRILILPLTGAGHANLTLVNLKVKYSVDYNLEDRNGETYVQVSTGKVSFDATGGHFELENLFNGDPVLGPQTNKFLNENWKDVLNELGPSVADTIGEVVRTILSRITAVVPYKYVFVE